MKLRKALQKAHRDCRRLGYVDWAALFKEAEAALAEPVADEPAPGYCKHCKKYTIAEPLPAERKEYPPLPEPHMTHFNRGTPFVCFTADQMRAYVDSDRAQRVPLLQREIFDLWDDARFAEGSSVENFARAIERAHGIGAKP